MTSSKFPNYFLDMLVCPQSHEPLQYDEELNQLLAKQSGWAYPVENGIPILLPEHAQKIDSCDMSLGI